jgi:glutamate synthase domain-containing protein 2
MVTEEGFMARVEQLRKAGAKHVFLKTGAYRPLDLARALKFASQAKLDLLTVDAAGGGTGMSPWRMMNEWGVPQVELHSLLYQYCKQLEAQGDYVPDIAIAGGFTFEDQIFKGFALGAPYFKLIGMARSMLAAAMVGKTLGRKIAEGDIPVYVERFGTTTDEIFVTAPELRKELGKRFNDVAPGALGLYTYCERLSQGIRQLMCGARKFSLDHITRDDMCAITREAADISGLPYVMDADKEDARAILKGKQR